MGALLKLRTNAGPRVFALEKFLPVAGGFRPGYEFAQRCRVQADAIVQIRPEVQLSDGHQATAELADIGQDLFLLLDGAFGLPAGPRLRCLRLGRLEFLQVLLDLLDLRVDLHLQRLVQEVMVEARVVLPDGVMAAG